MSTNYHDQIRKAKQDRIARILRMRERGMTMDEIGKIEGCSRQRISDLLKGATPIDARAKAA